MPAVAIRALREWRATTARERLLLGAEYQTDVDFVFCNESGRPLHHTRMYHTNFRRIMATAGLGVWDWESDRGRKRKRFRPEYRMYDLRHTCATLLLLAGENPKIVAERLGHASVTLTLDTYSHVVPAMQEESARKLEAMFGGHTI